MKTPATSQDYGIPVRLLRFLGACVYRDAGEYYAGLDESGRAELEKQGKWFGMTAWFYRYLRDVLPEEKREKYRNVYLARQVKAMQGEHELRRLYRMLAAHGLRFVPVKGADLAYRLYPDAALRTFGDWDIWFHPDDCERALAVLAEDGWKIPEGCPDDQAAVRADRVPHHYSPHIRGEYKLEPHFTLSNFKDAGLYEMWEQTMEYPAGDGQCVLSPEMNLLMLARHASADSYFHAVIPKLLTDAAMVIRTENVDFSALRALAVRWRFPYPGDLLAAFPEFFPADELERFGSDPAKAAAIRGLFELRAGLDESGNRRQTVLLNRYEARGQLAGSMLKYLRSLSVQRIRLIYRLPKHGAYGRVVWSYVCCFWSRALWFFAWMRRDRSLIAYGRMVESVESDRRSRDGNDW